MLLLEHEGKALLREFGIPVPKGATVRSDKEAVSAVAGLQAPFMVKAQVPAGGRGKSGGVLSAPSSGKLRPAVRELLRKTVSGHAVREVLIEEQAAIAGERYIAAMVDGEDMLLLLGSRGGIEVEAYFGDGRNSFEAIKIDPLYGLSAFQVRLALEKLDIPVQLWAAYTGIAERLVRLFRTCDATLAEINPLAELPDGSLKALDARITIDDGALFRQPRFAEIQETRIAGDGIARQMRELEIQYVPVGGNIGLVSSGAGVGVTILDWVEREGGRVAAFVDLDYTIISGRTEDGLRLVFDHFCDNPEIRAIIVNFTTCGLRLDQIARSLIEVLGERPSRRAKPLMLHLQGNRATLAHDLLRSHGFAISETLGDAVRAAVRQAKGVSA